MELPKVLPSLSKAEVAPKGKLNMEDLKKIVVNLVVFTAPATAAFFSLLNQGVPMEKAWPVALAILWGVLADYLKKLNDGGK